MLLRGVGVRVFSRRVTEMEEIRFYALTTSDNGWASREQVLLGNAGYRAA